MTPYIWHTDNLIHALTDLNASWHGDDFTQSTRITTDTRKIEQGDIFLALRGENFDGHDYVATAFEKGAVLVITSHKVGDYPQIIVDDTRLALGRLGKYRRDVHPDLTVIALTGSSGKTTTKEMLGAIFNQFAPTLVTRGNLNNDLGVPMMLLELTDEHKFAVMELGANHVGEIAYTASLVRPDVACVLNIGTAHLGEFGGQENIARAKAEIFSALTADGVAVLPFGDKFFDFLQSQSTKFAERYISFGEQAQKPQNALDFDKLSPAEIDELSKLDSVLVMGDVFADDVQTQPTHSTFEMTVNLAIDELDSVDVRLPFVGEHNITNALAAAAIATALGIPLDKIKSGLEHATPPKGRLTRMAFGVHTLIDDTYNANPNSIFMAGKVLANETNLKILVLGDIGELGDEAVSEHGKLGEHLASLQIDHLLTVGELMKHCATHANSVRADLARHFDDKAALVQHLNELLQSDTCTVLFKGSRTARMETLIDDLTNKNLTDKVSE